MYIVGKRCNQLYYFECIMHCGEKECRLERQGNEETNKVSIFYINGISNRSERGWENLHNQNEKNTINVQETSCTVSYDEAVGKSKARRKKSFRLFCKKRI